MLDPPARTPRERLKPIISCLSTLQVIAENLAMGPFMLPKYRQQFSQYLSQLNSESELHITSGLPKKRKHSEKSPESPKKFKRDDEKENRQRSPLERNCSLPSSDDEESSTTISVSEEKDPPATVSVSERSCSEEDYLSELKKEESELEKQERTYQQLTSAVMEKSLELIKGQQRFFDEMRELDIKLEDTRRKKHEIERKIFKEIRRQSKVALSREP